MERQEIIESLNEALSLEMRSFPIYLREAGSLTLSNEDRKVSEAIDKIGKEERQFAEQIADLIEQAGGKVEVRAFPMPNAHYNYLDVAYLRGVCEGKMRESLEAFRSLADRLKDVPEIGPALARIADAKSQHLKAIEATA